MCVVLANDIAEWSEGEWSSNARRWNAWVTTVTSRWDCSIITTMLAQNFRLLIRRSILPSERTAFRLCRRHFPEVRSRPFVIQQRRTMSTPPPHINVRSEVYEKGGLLLNDLQSQRFDHGTISCTVWRDHGHPPRVIGIVVGRSGKP